MLYEIPTIFLCVLISYKTYVASYNTIEDCYMCHKCKIQHCDLVIYSGLLPVTQVQRHRPGTLL